MMNGVMPGGLAGPFAAAQAGAKTLALPGSPSLGDARGVVVDNVELGSPVCSGVLHGGHRSGCDRRWDHAMNHSVSWNAPGDHPLNRWAAGVRVRSGKGVFAPAARARPRRSPSFC